MRRGGGRLDAGVTDDDNDNDDDDQSTDIVRTVRPRPTVSSNNNNNNNNDRTFGRVGHRHRSIVGHRLWLLLLTSSGFLSSPTRALKCYVCTDDNGFKVNRGNLRVITDLPYERCQMLEEVQCDREHDTCVTSTNSVVDVPRSSKRLFTITKGCERFSNLVFTTPPIRRGCHLEYYEQIEEHYGSTQRHIVRKSYSEICYCKTNRCNTAGRSVFDVGRRGTLLTFLVSVSVALVALVSHRF